MRLENLPTFVRRGGLGNNMRCSVKKEGRMFSLHENVASVALRARSAF